MQVEQSMCLSLLDAKDPVNLLSFQHLDGILRTLGVTSFIFDEIFKGRDQHFSDLEGSRSVHFLSHFLFSFFGADLAAPLGDLKLH